MPFNKQGLHQMVANYELLHKKQLLQTTATIKLCFVFLFFRNLFFGKKHTLQLLFALKHFGNFLLIHFGHSDIFSHSSCSCIQTPQTVFISLYFQTF